MQTLFTVLICVQFLVVVLHDWLNIPGWTHGRQVAAALGPVRMAVATVINALFPGVAVFFALRYWEQPKPRFVLDYWVVYCAITVLSAIQAWWWPYFRGASAETETLYAEMYAGTIQVLPARGNHPRPNLMHIYFHALFLSSLAVSVALWLRRG
jgi:hypothetical protein